MFKYKLYITVNLLDGGFMKYNMTDDQKEEDF